ncbi:MAG: hypothetical protein AABZ53_14895 [Planctomycetota bacterium]
MARLEEFEIAPTALNPVGFGLPPAYALGITPGTVGTGISGLNTNSGS